VGGEVGCEEYSGNSCYENLNVPNIPASPVKRKHSGIGPHVLWSCFHGTNRLFITAIARIFPQNYRPPLAMI